MTAPRTDRGDRPTERRAARSAVGLDARFDAPTRERLRRRLLQRGSMLSSLLADMLAGNDRSWLVAALGFERPGIRPHEAIRGALDHVERQRLHLIGGDDRYGRCDICGADLGVAALDAMAWADRCASHRAS